MQELPYFFPISQHSTLNTQLSTTGLRPIYSAAISKHNNSPLFFVYIKNYSYFCIVKC